MTSTATFHYSISGLAIVSTLVCAGTISAQEIALEGIVIVGERQEKSLLDTVSSVSVYGEDELATESGASVNAVIGTAPNVLVRSVSEAPNIRGIEGGGPGGLANTGLSGTVPRVPLIVDDVARIATLPFADFNSIWDLEQIEVFKGPQTTLRGRNAIAGAIVVSTKDPVFQSEKAAQVITEFDEYHGVNYTFNGMINGALIDDVLAVRATIEHSGGDDPRDIINVPAGRESDAEALTEFDQTRVRGKALLTPQGETGPLRILGLVEYQAGTTPQTRGTVQGPDIENREVDFTTGGLRLFETRAWTTALDGTYQFDDVGELQSITSYNTANFESRPEQPEPFFFDFTEKLFNQDLLFKFGEQTHRFSGLLGATYSHRKQDIVLDRDQPPFFLVGRNQLTADGETETLSAFTDLRLRLYGGLDLLAGGRILHEEQQRTTTSTIFSNLPGPPFSPPPTPPVTDVFDVTETVTLPKIGLQYKLDDENSIAVTAREGWNSGGAAVNFFTGQPYEFESERVWTYETTYRYVSRNQRYAFGVTAFYNDYEDPQFFLELQPGNRFSVQVVNLPASKTYGAELEGQAQFSDQLRLFGSLGLLETEITESIATNPALVGNRIGKDPDVTASAGFVWTPAFVQGVTFDGKVTYVSEFFNDFNNDPLTEAGGYALVDLGLTYRVDGIEARAYVNNVGDETGVTSRVISAPFSFAEITPPRTFGLSFKAEF